MAARVGSAAALAFFRARLRVAGSPARAAAQRAYLKSDLRFLGATMPQTRTAVAEFCRAHPDLTRADLRAIAEAAYATDSHDLRSAAIGVLERRAALLTGRDLGWLIDLVRRSNSWAYVDWLSLGVIGEVIAQDRPSLRRLPVWARDESFWVRRASLLAQHDTLKAGAGDFALFARLADGMLEEREFFIRKAIGWVLREVSKKRPVLVFRFLREHRERVSRLTLQEGAKYLSPSQRHGLGLPSAAAWARREQRRGARPA